MGTANAHASTVQLAAERFVANAHRVSSAGEGSVTLIIDVHGYRMRHADFSTWLMAYAYMVRSTLALGNP